jgi:hypothetical protein
MSLDTQDLPDMTNIVNPGSTLTVSPGSGLTLTSDGTVAAAAVLDGGGTISGAFDLLNLGVIEADNAATPLVIDTKGLSNAGTVEARNADLTIGRVVLALNVHGTLVADDGTLTVGTLATFNNLVNGTLTSGELESLGSGVLTLPGSIVTDDGTILLAGTASAITGPGSQPIEATLGTVGAKGVLDLYNARSLQTAGSLVIAGVVGLGGDIISLDTNAAQDGGTISAGGSGITITATGQIKGYGVIDPAIPVIDNGTIDAVGGTLTIGQPSQISGTGTLSVDSGATLVLDATGGSYAQTIVNDGVVAITTTPYFPENLTISGAYSGPGSFLIEGLPPGEGGPTGLVLPGSVSANVAFDANQGALTLQGPSQFSGTLTGFAAGDTIVLDGVYATSASLSGGELSLINAGTTVDALSLDTNAIDYSGAVFAIANNVNHTAATLTVSGTTQAPCYVEGTHIATLDGEVAVETLRPGDIVRTHFAGAAPVVWVGHRHVDCTRHPAPHKVLPILVEAHAFGPRTPHRDLYLSPDHAVYVDEVLIPIQHLVNRKTIRQVKVERVTYFHIELAEHDILLAEGLTAESYLENGDRQSFDNGGPVTRLHPEFGPRRWDTAGCAPLVLTGPALKAVKNRLDRRADNPRASGKRRRSAA